MIDLKFSKKGFSLAEMMVVLLILSIVLAASLPILTKRSRAKSDDSVWSWDSTNQNIYWSDGTAAMIGTSTIGSDATKLVLDKSTDAQTDIVFRRGGSDVGYLKLDKSANIDLQNNASYTYAAKAYNTSVGYNALIANTANNNTAIGSFALKSNSSGMSNTAIGYNALGASTITGGSTAIGDSALSSSTGQDNTAVGEMALTANTTGGFNTAIGQGSCPSVTTGSNNTCVGSGSDVPSGTASHQIIIGTSADTVYIPGRLMMGNIGDPQHSGWGYYDLTSSGTQHFKMYTDGSQYWSLYQVSSDRRLKNIKGQNSDGLDKINQLKVYNYTFKKDKKKTPIVGVIAQDLQKVFPNAVIKGKDGYLQIRIEDMFYAMVNAIQELDKNVKSIAAKVQQLDDKITAIINVDKINSQKIKALEAQNKILLNQNKSLDARLKKLEKQK